MTVLAADGGDPPPGLPAERAGVTWTFVPDPEALAEGIVAAEVMFLWDLPPGVLREIWGAAERLRWLHVASAGVDAVLFPALIESDVVLTNARGVFDRAMGEYTVALLLALAKDLPRTLVLQGAREWRHREPEMLAGTHLLVVGVGGIGRAVARLGVAMGMRVTGVGRVARPDDADFERVASVEELHRLVPQADHVVLAVPLTEATRGMFGRSLIERMKPAATLVNVARGAVVDEGALAEALAAGRIAGAALDVFVTEPLPGDHPLWDLPNAIVSPHMSGDWPGGASALADLFLRNLDAYLRGDPLANVVDKRLGFAPGP